MHQESEGEGRGGFLLPSVERIMIKAHQQQTDDVWIYISPPAQNTLPVANKEAPGKYSCIFLNRQKS